MAPSPRCRTVLRLRRRWCLTRGQSPRRSATCWPSDDRPGMAPMLGLARREAPVAVEVVMPRLGWTMETGSVAEWLKHDGDSVQAGDVLFTVETDKVAQEVEALDSGILRIPPDGVPAGADVPVGTVLGYLVQPCEPA